MTFIQETSRCTVGLASIFPALFSRREISIFRREDRNFTCDCKAYGDMRVYVSQNYGFRLRLSRGFPPYLAKCAWSGCLIWRNTWKVSDLGKMESGLLFVADQRWWCFVTVYNAGCVLGLVSISKEKSSAGWFFWRIYTIPSLMCLSNPNSLMKEATFVENSKTSHGTSGTQALRRPEVPLLPHTQLNPGMRVQKQRLNWQLCIRGKPWIFMSFLHHPFNQWFL